MAEGTNPEIAAKKIADTAIRINRKSKPSRNSVRGLAITIAVAPTTQLDLAREVELVKSAPLYADEVTLCSPTTTLLASADALTRLDRQQKLKYIVDIWPTLQPETAPNAEALRRFMSMRHQGGQGFALR